MCGVYYECKFNHYNKKEMILTRKYLGYSWRKSKKNPQKPNSYAPKWSRSCNGCDGDDGGREMEWNGEEMADLTKKCHWGRRGSEKKGKRKWKVATAGTVLCPLEHTRPVQQISTGRENLDRSIITRSVEHIPVDSEKQKSTGPNKLDRSRKSRPVQINSTGRMIILQKFLLLCPEFQKWKQKLQQDWSER